VGAARWPDLAPGLNLHDKSHTPENQAYSESMWRSSRRAGEAIASGRVTTFDALWSTATQWRLSRVPVGDSHRSDFASSRESGVALVTSLAGTYQSVKDRVLQHPDARTETYSGEYLHDIETKVYRQSGTLPQGTIPMTVISSATDPRGLSRQTWSRLGSGSKQEVQASLKLSHPDMITHTDPQYLPAISEKLESLYSRAIDPSLSGSEALDQVARLHWWAASAAPDRRGSAAKSEFAARSVASAHGIELPPFKHGVVPDIEAMLSSEDEFAARYASLFERDPL